MIMQFGSERCLIISVIASWWKDEEAVSLRDMGADVCCGEVH